MSSINPIASTKVAAAGTNGAAQPQALQGSSSGVFASGAAGANFWDMILSQITPNGLTKTATPATETTAKNAIDAANQTDGAAQLKFENSLAALQVALASQTMDDKGNIVLPNAATDAEKLQTQLDLTNQVINHLKNVLPENAEKDGIFGKIMSKLQSKSDTLQASLSALETGTIAKDTPVEDIPLPLLISLGLTPAQISEVTQKIDALEEKLGREITVEDLIAGVGGVIAPAPEAAPIAVASLSAKNASAASNTLDAIDENTEPTDDLAAQLNALDVGGEETAEEKPSANLDGKKQMQGLPEQSADTNNGNTDSKMKKDVTTFKENLVNMLNGNKSQQGDMTFPISYFGSETDSAIFQPYGFSATPALSLGTTAQTANMISSGAMAGQAHPATQVVAATLTKAGKDGSENVMTLRLDPPELGNVNIRLQFGKEKSVKAVITVEKPETFMMLQRDGHALERALQNAGLDANADSISFQMSPDNGSLAQDNNGRGDNGNNYSGGGNGIQDANASDIIQSSVMWQVDPSTGHVRYNIFA